ncbi:hypothetical protein FRC19_009122 [Serendipita sp. 401]|nr:hypothetical protein FRC19_009122 [Serendipita sp. 401]KAG9057032.1 hypothetical protein FS842_008866 [Serendipita sp. 407]
MLQLLRPRRIWIVLIPTVVFLLVHLFAAKSSPHPVQSPRSSSRNDFVDQEVTFETPFYTNETRSTGLNSQGRSAHRHSFKWTNATDIPETRVYAHLPGFTVLANVFCINGTLLLVSDRRDSFPDLKYILSSWKEVSGKTFVKEPTEDHIRVIDRKTALQILGISARVLRGTTWLLNDPTAYADESFSLRALRTHYMQEHRSRFNQSILPPTRILFPQISNKVQGIPLGLSSIPRLLFPSSGVGFKEDWHDYILLGRPIVFEHLVALDSAATSRSRRISTNAQETLGHLSVGSPLSVFNMIPAGWWSGWRNNMAKMLDIDAHSWQGESSSSVRPVVTYIFRQPNTGAVLDTDDHRQLIRNLNHLVDSHGYEVHIIDDREISFLERVKISLRTTVMLGTPGSGIMNAIWMHPSRLSLAIEIFPDNYLSTKQYFVIGAAGIKHLAWRGSQPLSETSTPLSQISESYLARANADIPPGTVNFLKQPIHVDAVAIVNYAVSWLEQDQGTEDEEM